jgi:hypothetical protein
VLSIVVVAAVVCYCVCGRYICHSLSCHLIAIVFVGVDAVLLVCYSGFVFIVVIVVVVVDVLLFPLLTVVDAADEFDYPCS